MQRSPIKSRSTMSGIAAAVHGSNQKPALRNLEVRRLYVVQIDETLPKVKIEKEFAEVFGGSLIEVIMGNGKKADSECCNPGFCFLEFASQPSARAAMTLLKSQPGVMAGRGLDGIEVNWCGQCVVVAGKTRTRHSAEKSVQESAAEASSNPEFTKEEEGTAALLVKKLGVELRADVFAEMDKMAKIQKTEQSSLKRRLEKVEEALKAGMLIPQANPQHPDDDGDKNDERDENDETDRNKETYEHENSSSYIAYENRLCGQKREEVQYLHQLRASSCIAAQRGAQEPTTRSKPKEETKTFKKPVTKK